MIKTDDNIDPSVFTPLTPVALCMDLSNVPLGGQRLRRPPIEMPAMKFHYTYWGAAARTII